MAVPETHGPIDTVVIEFPDGADGSATAAELLALVERGVISLYDAVVVAKGDDGTCVEVDPAAGADGRLGALGRFAGARSGLIGADDLPALAAILEPGTTAAVLVYENTWAVPFVSAAFSEGAELVASTRITADQVMDALDAADAAD